MEQRKLTGRWMLYHHGPSISINSFSFEQTDWYISPFGVERFPIPSAFVPSRTPPKPRHPQLSAMLRNQQL
jgi:hypothetical protein